MVPDAVAIKPEEKPIVAPTAEDLFSEISTPRIKTVYMEWYDKVFEIKIRNISIIASATIAQQSHELSKYRAVPEDVAKKIRTIVAGVVEPAITIEQAEKLYAADAAFIEELYALIQFHSNQREPIDWGEVADTLTSESLNAILETAEMHNVGVIPAQGADLSIVQEANEAFRRDLLAVIKAIVHRCMAEGRVQSRWGSVGDENVSTGELKKDSEQTSKAGEGSTDSTKSA